MVEMLTILDHVLWQLFAKCQTCCLLCRWWHLTTAKMCYEMEVFGHLLLHQVVTGYDSYMAGIQGSSGHPAVHHKDWTKLHNIIPDLFFHIWFTFTDVVGTENYPCHIFFMLGSYDWLIARFWQLSFKTASSPRGRAAVDHVEGQLLITWNSCRFHIWPVMRRWGQPWGCLTVWRSWNT
jgi:hypothetical protein